MKLAESYCLYGELISKYGFENYSRKVLNKALHILNNRNLNYCLKVADTLLMIGKHYKKNDNYCQALVIFSKVLYIRRKILSENHIKIADALYEIGQTYLSMKNSKASKYLILALNIYKKYFDSKTECLYKNIISAYQIENNLEKVKEFQLLLLNFYEQNELSSKNKLIIASHLFYIGYNFKVMKNYSKAYEYYHKSLVLYETLENQTDFVNSLKNEIDNIK